jgi:hypothetical protein
MPKRKKDRPTVAIGLFVVALVGAIVVAMIDAGDGSQGTGTAIGVAIAGGAFLYAVVRVIRYRLRN